MINDSLNNALLDEGFRREWFKGELAAFLAYGKAKGEQFSCKSKSKATNV